MDSARYMSRETSLRVTACWQLAEQRICPQHQTERLLRPFEIRLRRQGSSATRPWTRNTRVVM
eukprot:1895151-Amphidinium_carterae.2